MDIFEVPFIEPGHALCIRRLGVVSTPSWETLSRRLTPLGSEVGAQSSSQST